MMKKNKLALGVMAVSIFGMGVGVGIVMSKCVMKKRGVII